MRKNKKLTKFIASFLITTMLLPLIPFQTVEAKTTGHTGSVIQSSVNGSRFSATVIDDDNDWGKGYEAGGSGSLLKKKGGAISYFNYIVKNNGSYSSSFKTNDIDAKDVIENYGADSGDKALFMTFPAHDAPDGSGDSAYDKIDSNRATFVASELETSLNLLIDDIDGLDNEDDVNSGNIGEAAKMLAGSLKNPSFGDESDKWTTVTVTFDSGSSCYIHYYIPNKTTMESKGLEGAKAIKDYNATGDNSIKFKMDENTRDILLYGYVSTNSETPTSSNVDSMKRFTWAMLKGYLSPCGNALNENGTAKGDGNQDYSAAWVKKDCSASKVTDFKGTADGGDIPWITIFDIASYASIYYYSMNVDAQTVDNSQEMGLIEETITNIGVGIVNKLTRLLGLKDVTALIYETDGEGSLTGGVMAAGWWSIMLKYHLIFQLVAWMVIGIAVAKMILELNFSTISPSKRLSLMDEFSKLFIVGFLLALAIPIVRCLIDINNLVVGLFATQGYASDKALFGVAGKSIADVVIAFSYLGINVMLNATYILRGIMIAIFGASAPLFIVSMLFTKGKGLFDNWIKEMVANIFLQSVHAFSFTFLSDILKTSSGWLSKLVIIYSLMPIAEQFRSFIFGSSGGFATSQGMAVGGFMLEQGKQIAGNTAKLGAGMANSTFRNSHVALKDTQDAGGMANTSSVGAGGGKHGVGGKTSGLAETLTQGNHAALGAAVSMAATMGSAGMNMTTAMAKVQQRDFGGAARDHGMAIEDMKDDMSQKYDMASAAHQDKKTAAYQADFDAMNNAAQNGQNWTDHKGVVRDSSGNVVDKGKHVFRSSNSLNRQLDRNLGMRANTSFTNSKGEEMHRLNSDNSFSMDMSNPQSHGMKTEFLNARVSEIMAKRSAEGKDVGDRNTIYQQEAQKLAQGQEIKLNNGLAMSQRNGQNIFKVGNNNEGVTHLGNGTLSGQNNRGAISTNSFMNQVSNYKEQQTSFASHHRDNSSQSLSNKDEYSLTGQSNRAYNQ